MIADEETKLDKQTMERTIDIYIKVANTMSDVETLTFKEIFIRYVDILKNENPGSSEAKSTTRMLTCQG